MLTPESNGLGNFGCGMEGSEIATNTSCPFLYLDDLASSVVASVLARD